MYTLSTFLLSKKRGSHHIILWFGVRSCLILFIWWSLNMESLIQNIIENIRISVDGYQVTCLSCPDCNQMSQSLSFPILCICSKHTISLALRNNRTKNTTSKSPQMYTLSTFLLSKKRGNHHIILWFGVRSCLILFIWWSLNMESLILL